MFSFLRRARSVTKIGLVPPTPVPDRFGLAIVLIVRNEERHIAEWARFHHLAGARHFVVYDNGCTDGTLAQLRAALPEAALTVIPWSQKLTDATRGLELHNQVLAYAHAVRNFGAQYRWMSFIDVDEFLVPLRHADLNAALADLADCRNISLPWHMFGRCGHDAPPPGGVVQNYTRRHPDPLSRDRGLCNFKMIVDPCHVTALRVHTVWTDGSADTHNDAGRPIPAARRDTGGYTLGGVIQLNHYYTRSDSELRAKIARGPNLTTPDADHLRRVMRKVENIERDEVEDRAAPEFLARIGHGGARPDDVARPLDGTNMSRARPDLENLS